MSLVSIETTAVADCGSGFFGNNGRLGGNGGGIVDVGEIEIGIESEV